MIYKTGGLKAGLQAREGYTSYGSIAETVLLLEVWFKHGSKKIFADGTVRGV